MHGKTPLINRNVTLDVTKGIGIILVVIGHNWINLTHHELSEVIYSFHMPLFFFLSGVLLKDSVKLGKFAAARLVSLLKPYFIVLTLVGCISFLTVQANTFSVLSYLLGILWGIGQSIAWPPLWFLPHLFVASLLTLSLLKLAKSLPPVMLALMFTGLLILGVYFIKAFWDENRLIPEMAGLKFLNGLPWSADLAPISSAYMGFGYLLRNQIKFLTLNIPMLILALLMFSGLHSQFDVSINLNLRAYGQPVISSLQAALGIYLTLTSALLLQRIPLLQKILSYCGTSTLFILLFHGFIQNRIFHLLTELAVNNYVNSGVSFLCALLGSMALWELSKQNVILARLLLPMPKKSML